MPSIAQKSPRQGGAGKIVSFTSFAKNLLSRLPRAIDPPSIESLLAELKPHLEKISTLARAPKGRRSEKNELDKTGTELWNLCTRILRDDSSEPIPQRRKLLLHSRAFAFFFIDVARSEMTGCEGQPRLEDVVHVMRLALKAGKTCIDENNLNLAGSLLAKAADYSNTFDKLRETMLGPDDLAECTQLEAEYYIVRTALSWKADNLQVADYMFGKGKITPRLLDPASAERMAGILLDIGKDLSKKNDFSMAVRWLERANDIINSQGLDRLSRDAVELRLAITQALIHAHLGVNTKDSSDRALELVNYIESEVGEKPVALLLRMELLQKTPAEVFDVDAYAEILRRMVRSFNFSEAHFKLLLHHARSLHDKSPTLASNVVDGMLNSTMVSSGQDEWVERLVLLKLWMETSQRDTMKSVEDLYCVLDDLQSNLTKPFGASAAVGALTLIWKKIEINYNQGHFDLADGWCRVALQSLFQNGGPANRSRLGRKLILCALGSNNTEKARQAFHEMPEAAQNETMTRYLMYKVALRSADRELATDCLERVGLTASQDPNFLYACMLEAQKAGDKVCAVQAMKQLVQRHEYKDESPIHLPALLRCNIRLAISVMENEKNTIDRGAAVNEVVGLFEESAKAVQRDPKDKDGRRFFTVKELDWFCQNAYNLGLKNSDVWELGQLIRLFDSCFDLAKHYPPDLPAPEESDLAFRMMFCHFVVAAALISIARTEDNVERQMQHYNGVRKHVEAYDGLLQPRIKGLEERLASDLYAKYATLLVFDFEAAMALKNYDAFGYIIRLAATCHDANALKAMGDIVLRGRLPGDRIMNTLGVIVNEIWELEKMTGDRLAKYIRCMFQAVLPLDAASGQTLMRQAITIARESAKTTRPFPPEELEWLVTTAFNHAVDVYNARLDDECNKWADLAMNLAHYADDKGALEKTLQENRMKLRFDVE